MQSKSLKDNLLIKFFKSLTNPMKIWVLNCIQVFSKITKNLIVHKSISKVMK